MKISERVMLGVMRKNAVEILGKNFLGSYLRVSYTFFQCFFRIYTTFNFSTNFHNFLLFFSCVRDEITDRFDTAHFYAIPY